MDGWTVQKFETELWFGFLKTELEVFCNELFEMQFICMEFMESKYEAFFIKSFLFGLFCLPSPLCELDLDLFHWCLLHLSLLLLLFLCWQLNPGEPRTGLPQVCVSSTSERLRSDTHQWWLRLRIPVIQPQVNTVKGTFAHTQPRHVHHMHVPASLSYKHKAQILYDSYIMSFQ